MGLKVLSERGFEKVVGCFSVEQAVVEVGTTSLWNLSHCNFRLVLVMVINIYHGRLRFGAGFGNYGVQS